MRQIVFVEYFLDILQLHGEVFTKKPDIVSSKLVEGVCVSLHVVQVKVELFSQFLHFILLLQDGVLDRVQDLALQQDVVVDLRK